MAAVAIDYGWDLSCTDDLTEEMLEVGGNTVLIEALYRRLITPRGRLLDDPNYGFDLRQYLNADIDISARTLGEIASGIEQEFAKDQRVRRSTVSVTYDARARVLMVVADVVGLNGTFSLVLAATDVNVTLLKAA